MKRIPALFRDLFSPKDLHGLDVQEILGAMSDASIRKVWLSGVFDELQRMNLEVDKRLLGDTQNDLTDLAARRKAFQDVLESVLSARRRVKNLNPQSGTTFDLDSVTVRSVPMD